jgi:hypothetical protein
MDKEQVRFKKIHLDSFIKQLAALYEMGVDYVDLVGMNNVEQDYIEMHFTNDYMTPELRKEIGEQLSDEDLNQII